MYKRSSSKNIPCDGTITNFNLQTGNPINSSQPYDLSVRLVRNPLILTNNEHFDWTLTLTISNGGFKEIHDLYPNIAPIDGYVPTITIHKNATDADWTPMFKGNYYFNCRSGKSYGTIAFDLDAAAQTPPTAFDARILCNPSGSRNLEYDPDKRIDPFTDKLVYGYSHNKSP